MLTYHQLGSVVFIWGHYHRIWRYRSLLKFACLKSHPDFPGTNELIYMRIKARFREACIHGFFQYIYICIYQVSILTFKSYWCSPYHFYISHLILKLVKSLSNSLIKWPVSQNDVMQVPHKRHILSASTPDQKLGFTQPKRKWIDDCPSPSFGNNIPWGIFGGQVCSIEILYRIIPITSLSAK